MRLALDGARRRPALQALQSRVAGDVCPGTGPPARGLEIERRPAVVLRNGDAQRDRRLPNRHEAGGIELATSRFSVPHEPPEPSLYMDAGTR
jgi:hypothetical protein